MVAEQSPALLLLRAHLYFAARIWLCNPYKM
jgi:hypothetical protein